MSYEIGVNATFPARHHLVGDFGPARDPHSHEYRLDVAVTGPSLQADGTLIDISQLDAALATIVAELTGQDLNVVPELTEANPTAEVVARYVHDRLAPALRAHGLAELRVRVWESTAAYASYTGALD
jgi:6-pyruvoyltetrahydropterin/6-carboxytetrahydropterin synthase